MENRDASAGYGSAPVSRLPGMATRAQRKKLPLKTRVALVEEFIAALLPLTLHLADQLEETTGRPYLRDVFPNREKFSSVTKKPSVTKPVDVGAVARGRAEPAVPLENWDNEGGK